jgi:hypothetical protein
VASPVDPARTAPVRAYLGEIAGQAPATRKRKRAAVASFCTWAVRHELLAASPMDRIGAIEVPRTLPRPAAAADVAAVLDAICSRRPRKDVPLGVLRDRVLFETACVCGARASEACGMYVEDLDLRPDDEHARIHGKGGTVRTVLGRRSGPQPSPRAARGPGGSGRFPIQRRRRKARSLRAGLPNRAVPMTMSITTTSMMAMTSPRMGWSIPIPTGVASEATPALTDRQGTRSRIAGAVKPGCPPAASLAGT